MRRKEGHVSCLWYFAKKSNGIPPFQVRLLACPGVSFSGLGATLAPTFGFQGVNARPKALRRYGPGRSVVGAGLAGCEGQPESTIRCQPRVCMYNFQFVEDFLARNLITTTTTSTTD